MSRTTQELPTREIHARSAKQKATNEINKYFRPKRVLQLIAENDEMMFQKKPLTRLKLKNKTDKKDIKDENNNVQVKKKRSLKDLEEDSIEIGENTSVSQIFNEAKRKKSFETSTPIGKKKDHPKDDGIESDMSPSPSTSSSTSENSVIVLDSSSAASSGVMVESSLSSTGTQTEYDFDALKTDDPTDDEDPERHPYWSLSQNRRAIVKDQTDVNFDVIDQFFGCKAETVESVSIFPDSKPIERRRSTAIWNTPPCYSTLPKH